MSLFCAMFEKTCGLFPGREGQRFSRWEMDKVELSGS